MKVLIVDDEAPARERLRRMVEQLDGYEVGGEAANGREAVEWVASYPTDVVLLDIRMPVMDGLEAAAHMSAHETPPAVIFTTAYGDHALEAFQTHAMGYLLKPVRAERLEETLRSAQRTTRAQLAQVAEDAPGDRPRTHICVRHRGNLELIPIEEVYYFQAQHKYVTLRHTGGEALIEDPLVQLEREFNNHFLRIHRNALVSVEAVAGMEKDSDGSHKITFKQIDDRLDISRRHLPNVRRFLKANQ